MDVAVCVFTLNGNRLTIPATQNMIVRDLRKAVARNLELRPTEAATCGFFQTGTNGFNVFVSDDTMLVDIYSPGSRFTKILLYMLIVPDVSGIRPVVEDSKLRAKCHVPDYYFECSSTYRNMLICHALDKIYRGHALACNDRILDNTADLCCYFIAVKYGKLILELNQHVIPLEISRDLAGSAWNPETLTEDTMQSIYRDTRALLKYATSDSILLDFLYYYSKLLLYDSFSIPAIWVRGIINKGGGQTDKVTHISNDTKPLQCYLLLTHEYVLLTSKDGAQVLESAPVEDFRRIFYYTDYLTLYFCTASGRELYLNFSMLCTENSAHLIKAYYVASSHIIGRYVGPDVTTG